MKTKARIRAIVAFIAVPAIVAILGACQVTLDAKHDSSLGSGVIFSLSVPEGMARTIASAKVLKFGIDELRLTATSSAGDKAVFYLNFSRTGNQCETSFIQLEPGTWDFVVEGLVSGRTQCLAEEYGVAISTDTLTLKLKLVEVLGDVVASVTVPTIGGDALLAIEAMVWDNGETIAADTVDGGDVVGGVWEATLLDLAPGNWNLVAICSYASGDIRTGMGHVVVEPRLSATADILVSELASERMVRFVSSTELVSQDLDVLWADYPASAGTHYQLESGTYFLGNGIDLPPMTFIEGGYLSEGVKGGSTTLMLDEVGNFNEWDLAIRSWGGRVGIKLKDLVIDANGKQNALYFHNQSVATLENVRVVNCGFRDRTGDGISETDAEAILEGRWALDINNSAVRLVDCDFEVGINAYADPGSHWFVSMTGSAAAPGFSSKVSKGRCVLNGIGFKAVNTRFEFVPENGWDEVADYKGFQAIWSSSSDFSMEGCEVVAKATGALAHGKFCFNALWLQPLMPGFVATIADTRFEVAIGPNVLDVPEIEYNALDIKFLKPGSFRIEGSTIEVTDLHSYSPAYYADGTWPNHLNLLRFETRFGDESLARIEVVDNLFRNATTPIPGNTHPGFFFIYDWTEDGHGGSTAAPLRAARMDVFSGNSFESPSAWPDTRLWWLASHLDAGTSWNDASWSQVTDKAEFETLFGGAENTIVLK